VTPFERIGGEAKLRPLIDEFVDRCFDDLMIGFFFRRASRERVKLLEYQHAARFLGADIPYEGRSLELAHRRHPIMGGQFARRLQILREVLEAYDIPPDVRDAWLDHQESLRDQITGDPDSNCDAERARTKLRNV
jgi:truncated hemoglobin YjbI